jgi:hypothetical protein
VNRTTSQPEPSSTAAPTDVVVVGAGRWGTLHVAKLRAMPGVSLAAVVDLEFERARRLAGEWPGAVPLAGLDALECLGPSPGIALVATSIDALASDGAQPASAAASTCWWKSPRHRRRARRGSLLIGCSGGPGARFAVGFVERFNAGLSALPPGARALVVRRIGPATPRSGFGIALDWGIHDLDLAATCSGARCPSRRRDLGDGVDLRVRLSGTPRATQALLVAVRAGRPAHLRGALWSTVGGSISGSPGDARTRWREQWAGLSLASAGGRLALGDRTGGDLGPGAPGSRSERRHGRRSGRGVSARIRTLLCVAGEASGDALLAPIVSSLTTLHGVRCVGTAGDASAAAGMELWAHVRDFAAHGLIEAAPAVPALLAPVAPVSSVAWTQSTPCCWSTRRS